MKVEEHIALLEECKIELGEAVDRFELFDYEYLLDIERIALKYMAKYFKASNIVHHNECIVRDISLCLKLLDIAAGRDFYSNNLFHENEGINAPYVNTRNKDRFIKHTAKSLGSPAIEFLIREIKAWNLYCRVRSNMQAWWD